MSRWLLGQLHPALPSVRCVGYRQVWAKRETWLLAMGFTHGQAVTLIYVVHGVMVSCAYLLRWQSDVVLACVYLLFAAGVFGVWSPVDRSTDAARRSADDRDLPREIEGKLAPGPAGIDADLPAGEARFGRAHV